MATDLKWAWVYPQFAHERMTPNAGGDSHQVDWSVTVPTRSHVVRVVASAGIGVRVHSSDEYLQLGLPMVYRFQLRREAGPTDTEPFDLVKYIYEETGALSCSVDSYWRGGIQQYYAANDLNAPQWQHHPVCLRQATYSASTAVVNQERSDGSVHSNTGDVTYAARLTVLGGDLYHNGEAFSQDGEYYYTLLGSLKVLYETEV